MNDAETLIEKVHKTFKEYGMVNGYANQNKKAIEELQEKSAKQGVRFIEIKQKHIGSDYLVEIIDNIYQDLIKKGAKIYTETEVLDATYKDNKIISVVTNNNEYKADYFVFCVGRFGSVWFQKLA